MADRYTSLDADTATSATALDEIDPRGMAERFTIGSSFGATGMLGLAEAFFGVVFDDKSEIDIYKVYTGPPTENLMGFFHDFNGF